MKAILPPMNEGIVTPEIDPHGVARATPGELQTWHAEFAAAAARPLRQRMRYAFIRTYKPVLDDARFRAFDSMADYRSWCERSLPVWLGYHR